MPTELKQEHGHPMFHEVVREITRLHEEKNRQYATSTDPLGNFRRTGQIISKMLKPGLNPSLASCLAFMSKQVDGVYEIFGEDKKNTVDSLEDKLLDIAIYSIIGIVLVREWRAAVEFEPAKFDPASAPINCWGSCYRTEPPRGFPDSIEEHIEENIERYIKPGV